MERRPGARSIAADQRQRRRRSGQARRAAEAARGWTLVKAAGPGAVEIPRILFGLVALFTVLLAMKGIQELFDASDQRQATAIVRDHRAVPGGPTVSQVILARHPYLKAPQALHWKSEITSGCLGTVRVSAVVPRKSWRPEAVYTFDVGLADTSILPTDEKSSEILKSLTTGIPVRKPSAMSVPTSSRAHTSTTD